MDYEKKYKELVAKIKNAHLYAQTDSTKNVLEGILPELAESEDERMMHQLHSWMKEFGGAEEYTEKVYTWLKSLLKKQGEQKPTDEVEPKFQNGQWIVWQNKCYKVNYNGCGYELIDQNGLSTSLEYGTVDKSASAFTIQDAKDGDVLVCPLPKGCESGEQIFIFKGINSRDYVENCIEYYCRVCEGEFYENKTGYMGTTSSPIYPATKEQRDLLFQKIKDAGYKWDEGKKELKKIEKKSQRMISAEAKEALYDKPTDNDMVEALRTEYEKGRADAIAEMEKPTWSVEDMSKVQRICKYLDEAKKYYADITEVRECIDLLKSLKDRVIPQSKQEWSEDDEAHINGIIDYLLDYKLFVYEEDMNVANGVQKELDWLKSLQRIGG